MLEPSRSASGHFRPIQRGFAMSGSPSEADVGTARIYENTPYSRPRFLHLKVETNLNFAVTNLSLLGDFQTLRQRVAVRR